MFKHSSNLYLFPRVLVLLHIFQFFYPTAAMSIDQEKAAAINGQFKQYEVYLAHRKPEEASEALEEAVSLLQREWNRAPASVHPRGTNAKELVEKLQKFVVNTGSGGKLSQDGDFSSTPVQIEAIFDSIEQVQDRWSETGRTSRRDILLYVHGGLVSETRGLQIANQYLNCWLSNGIYPINFVWESGLGETFKSLHRRKNQSETHTRMLASAERAIVIPSVIIEKTARRVVKPLWDEMKRNAIDASRPLAEDIDWGSPEQITSTAAGASLVVDRLAEYVVAHPNTRIHLVGHSAGSIFSIGLIERLAERNVKIETVSFLAPAMRMDDFRQFVVPRLADGTVRNLYIYNLTDDLEKTDVSAIKGLGYKGSLLYLVARALESPGLGENPDEVPLLGMDKFYSRPVTTLTSLPFQKFLTRCNASVVLSNPLEIEDRSPLATSYSHGGFDDDPATLNSIARSIVGDKLRVRFPRMSKKESL